MTHKKSRRTVSKAERRVITFIICIFLIGAIIGGITVAAVSAFKGSEQKTQLSDELYGTRDGRYITENGGLTFNYEFGSEFEPLECALPVELQEFTYYLCEARVGEDFYEFYLRDCRIDATDTLIVGDFITAYGVVVYDNILHLSDGGTRYGVFLEIYYTVPQVETQ